MFFNGTSFRVRLPERHNQHRIFRNGKSVIPSPSTTSQVVTSANSGSVNKSRPKAKGRQTEEIRRCSSSTKWKNTNTIRLVFFRLEEGNRRLL
nr:protein tesmin/TSO1-like CXC 5 isoform X3 [Ipomoea trifida]